MFSDEGENSSLHRPSQPDGKGCNMLLNVTMSTPLAGRGDGAIKGRI